jgi:hypothetical protein
MNMQWFTKHRGDIPTLKLKRNPLRHGLGHYEDLDGNVWDITCIFGGDRPHVNARLVDGSPYYSTASNSHSLDFHRWKPYYFEMHEKETQEN